MIVFLEGQKREELVVTLPYSTYGHMPRKLGVKWELFHKHFDCRNIILIF